MLFGLLPTTVWAADSYTVTWKNEDGTVLRIDENVAAGTRPVYVGKTPRKDAGQYYTFSFKDWTPTRSAVTEDVTYTATYQAFPKSEGRVYDGMDIGERDPDAGLLHVAIMADPHVVFHDGKQADIYGDTILDAKERGAEKILVAGDLAWHGQNQEYDLYHNTVARYAGDTEVIESLGNHELASDTPKAVQVKMDRWRTRMKTGLYFSQWIGNTHIVGMGNDEQYYNPEEGGYYMWRGYPSMKQLDWLENVIEEDDKNNVTTIVLFHWNIGSPFAPPFPSNKIYNINNRERERRLFEIVSSHDNVVYFSGHTHEDRPIVYQTPSGGLLVHGGHVYMDDITIRPLYVMMEELPSEDGVRKYELKYIRLGESEPLETVTFKHDNRCRITVHHVFEKAITADSVNGYGLDSGIIVGSLEDGVLYNASSSGSSLWLGRAGLTINSAEEFANWVLTNRHNSNQGDGYALSTDIDLEGATITVTANSRWLSCKGHSVSNAHFVLGDKNMALRDVSFVNCTFEGVGTTDGLLRLQGDTSFTRCCFVGTGDNPFIYKSKDTNVTCVNCLFQKTSGNLYAMGAGTVNGTIALTSCAMLSPDCSCIFGPNPPTINGSVSIEACISIGAETETGLCAGNTKVNGTLDIDLLICRLDDSKNVTGISYYNDDVLRVEQGKLYATYPISYNPERYTLVSMPENASGVALGETIEITYFYNKNQYILKFVNEDGTELQSNEAAYGAMPIYSGETPTKDGERFVSWTPELAPVTGDAVYTATYQKLASIPDPKDGDVYLVKKAYAAAFQPDGAVTELGAVDYAAAESGDRLYVLFENRDTADTASELAFTVRTEEGETVFTERVTPDGEVGAGLTAFASADCVSELIDGAAYRYELTFNGASHSGGFLYTEARLKDKPAARLYEERISVRADRQSDTCTVTVDYRLGEDRNGVIVMACYDGEGRQVGVALAVLTNGGDGTVTRSIHTDGEAATVKALLLDSGGIPILAAKQASVERSGTFFEIVSDSGAAPELPDGVTATVRMPIAAAAENSNDYALGLLDRRGISSPQLCAG